MLLVIEDDESLRDLLENAFAEAGFSVVTVCNGTQAIAELDTNAGRFNVVVTDINLGSGPDGWQIGRHARQLVPKMPIVYVTAASADEWTAEGVTGSVLAIKPFSLAHITAVVAGLLAASDSPRAPRT